MSRTAVKKNRGTSIRILSVRIEAYPFVDAAFLLTSWKLPAYSGAFLLTDDNFSFVAYNFSFLLTILAFLLTMEKCV